MFETQTQPKMTHQQLINSTIAFVKQTLANAEGGHDWWHIYRVWQLAKNIAATEDVELLVVELGALLHDIADAKFHKGDESIGPRLALEFMKANSVDDIICEHVVNIISNISFAGGNHNQLFNSKELAVVQDADRLDALGAIGIARTFNYGGFKNREMYNPSIKPKMNMSKEEYRNSSAPTLNHFYEKLLLLKDRMNTETGKRMAAERHQFMELFLEQFYAEWDGQK